jgi:signal peptidase II
MTKRRRVVLVLFIILMCVGCDQITKVMAKEHLPRKRVLSFAGDTLRLDYNVNKGAVFSFEYSLPEKWRGSAMTVAVAVLVSGLVLYLLLGSTMGPISIIALSLFCGGSLSNLLDRALLGGQVIDFLNFGWGAFRSSIFNVADGAITVGALVFVLTLLWSHLPSRWKARKAQS